MSLRRLQLGFLLLLALCGPALFAQEPTEEAGGMYVGPVKDTHKPAQPMPIRYDADRFFVEPITVDMDEMTYLTSTGDNDFIYSDKVAELTIPISLQGTKSSVFLPEFNPDHTIPVSRGSEGRLRIKPKRLRRAYLGNDCWGILGQDWFADRVWRFDYPNKKLSLLADNDTPTVPAKHSVSLGFRVGSRRERASNKPRISILVAGESIDMVLNTGATIALSANTVKTLADGIPANRAATFITDTRLAAWQKKHGWRVIEKAEHGDTGTMIEVPKVTIGGYEVGPIWFSARPARLYKDQLSRQHDAPIEGSLGGNVLKSFRLTVDYPKAKAYFEKP